MDSAVVYIFADPSSGDPNSDEIGSDSVAGLGFVYTRVDDLLLGYNAPSVGLLVMRGPSVDDDHIDNDGDGMIDEAGEELRPTMISGYYDLNEHEEDSTTYYVARTGCEPGRLMIKSKGCVRTDDIQPRDKREKFWAPDDPATRTVWEADEIPFYREFMFSMGPFTWLSGTTKTIEFASLWVRASSSIEAAHNIRGYARNLLSVRDQLYRASIPEANATDGNELPNDYGVSRPYPNPATRSTTMQVRMATDEEIEIKLFNAIGREVLTRFESLSTGNHELTLDISGLASGMYYYRIMIRSAASSGTLVISN